MSDIVSETKESMEKSYQRLVQSLQKMRTGRATPALLDDIYVDYFGSSMPIQRIATLATPEPRVITIQPFDKSSLDVIEKKILSSNIGVTPQNDGKVIRLIIPPLSQDRRKEMVKQCKKIIEEGKVAFRTHRQDANQKVKSFVKDNHLPEDQSKKMQDSIQKVTDEYIKKADVLSDTKEKEILQP
jgi:ribosome recycling factor